MSDAEAKVQAMRTAEEHHQDVLKAMDELDELRTSLRLLRVPFTEHERLMNALSDKHEDSWARVEASREAYREALEVDLMSPYEMELRDELDIVKAQVKALNDERSQQEKRITELERKMRALMLLAERFRL